jgi:hypothetical protein
MLLNNFKIPAPPEDVKTNPPTFEESKERKKIFECSQFDCLPRHLGKAVAMKNYWVYLYDHLPP